jgi:hypothetical protein
MPLTKIKIPAGINRESTEYAAGSSWYDCDNIRFRGGVAESISGWTRDSMYMLNGIGRACFSSRDYSGNNYQFVGTNWKFYVIVGTEAYDITGLGPAITAFSDFLSTTSGTPFVKVTLANHGVKVNDWINFVSVADASVGGLTQALLTQVDGFQVTEVDGLNDFYIYIEDGTTGLPVNATSTVNNQGGAITYRLRTVAGTNAVVRGSGFGAGVWGGTLPPEPTRGWGDPAGAASSILTNDVRRVYIDNYGEDVMFANSGGPIFYWDTSSNTTNGVPGSGASFGLDDAAVALNSIEFAGSQDPPDIVDSFLVSKRDGSCVAFGCNDIGSSSQNSLLVRWSDQNNPFDWRPTPTNTAGGQVLRVGSKIIGGVPTKDEVVVFTDAAVYSMRFIGPPNIFSFSLISQNVEIVSHKSAAEASSSVFFMGNDGFYVYTGGAVRNLECPVAKFIYDDLNFAQAQKTFSAVDSRYSEIMWFYPSKSGQENGSFEPDKFVCFNYEELTWTIGTFDMSSVQFDGGMQSATYNRTAWRDAINTDNPMASYLYMFDQSPGLSGGRANPIIEKSAVMIHNSGTSAQGGPINSFVSSGDVEISDGPELSFYSQIIPDLMVFNSSGESSVTLSLQGKYYPGDANSSQEGSVVANFAAPAAMTPSVVSSYTVGSGAGSDAYVRAMHIRGRARAASLKVSASSTSAQWRLGDVRIDLRPDGSR